MYRKTRFGALLKGLSRGSFEKTVDQFQADKYSKGFRCWDQVVALIYGQVSGCRGLRELDMKRPASQIAELYKSRWDIELFFKWLKQNLKIKQFLGRSENAVRLQIYIALITYCLMWCYRKTQGLGDSMHLCLAVLKTSLFQRPEMERKVMRRRQRKRWQSLHTQGSLAL